MIRFRDGVQVWLFTSRIADVLQFTSLWSGRTCIDVDIVRIDDAPIDKMAAALRAETFTIDLTAGGDLATGAAPLADFLRGSLDPRYDVQLLPEGVRIEWDLPRGLFTMPGGRRG